MDVFNVVSQCNIAKSTVLPFADVDGIRTSARFFKNMFDVIITIVAGATIGSVVSAVAIENVVAGISSEHVICRIAAAVGIDDPGQGQVFNIRW